MIVVTGAAGFIGSCMVSKLNQLGRDDILAVDALNTTEKWKNLRHLAFADYLDKSELVPFLRQTSGIEAIVHMGACSATTETDAHYLLENNYRYTLDLARYALENNIRFIYASSAATYGDGSRGYDDDEARIHELMPLNMYGYSKQAFDLKARREGWLTQIAGLKFFNVYGPNEYYKGDMSSVVFKAFQQIKADGKVRLFRSHHPQYKDGGQLRDFIYVKDVLAAMVFLLEHHAINGLFNMGTGRARSFKDLAVATFRAMDTPVNIEYIDMPESIRDRYQYYTQAAMDKLRGRGFVEEPHGLEEGIDDYVRHYLAKGPRAY